MRRSDLPPGAHVDDLAAELSEALSGARDLVLGLTAQHLRCPPAALS